ncbi:MAG: glucose-1-phosphate adenylyltransferase, partial [Armatimonadetes bacterium]|nr:glucose-1-phosphate adenylyltransferase [Armatimonadota bacterium]
LLEDCEVEHSVVGVRSVIGPGCRIRDSLLMGNDGYLASAVPQAQVADPSLPDELGLRADCHIEGAIIDKNVRIGESVYIQGRPGTGINRDAEDHFVRDGIVIVPRSQVLPTGTRIVVQ